MTLRAAVASLIALACLTPLPASAGTILEQPICFTLYNAAPYRVTGHIMTDVFVRPDGGKGHHIATFKLDPGKRTQVCSSGPFFEGLRLELTIKTLFPVFSCQTKVDGEIVIEGRRDVEGKTKTYALCR